VTASPPTRADVTAGVGATIAAYTQALDDGRTDDVIATFCPDGECDMPGLGHHVGHDALRAAYAPLRPATPQRHLVFNVLLTNWNACEAHATSDVALLLREESGWTVRLVGRYHDVLHSDDGERWLFHSRRAEFTAEKGHAT
jgi:SnoaL-like domain